MRGVLLALVIVSAGCSQVEERRSASAETFTLYRNSPIDRSLRVHWATFDVEDSDRSYNRNNCEMAARLLNANVGESARVADVEPYDGVGFWCESGEFSEEGSIPSMFAAAYPTDVPEQHQVP